MASPVVVEAWRNREYVLDLYSRMLRDRIIVLDTAIEDWTATMITSQLLFLEQANPWQEIALYINSPGGLISAGLAIYDTMQFITCPVATCCMGQAASMAAVLLAAGSPGRRFSLPHSRIMIHQPHGGYAGQASDIQIHAQEITRLKGLLTDILAEHSGISREELEPMLDRDTFLSPQEALDLGIIDSIIRKR
ncbi:ATP-dependent Clp protease proteolytic subunit [uncultured Bilophila sp.]|uniref:ATP-dependent Clp protease proteolytic subunit n=1 Tax=uncultured Bilophila sp. TaxID=529385 RepID=UPI00266F22C8|nr:ATP-dependent Clp protease proteolytic subunit [uncultured Bilophila sp.]